MHDETPIPAFSETPANRLLGSQLVSRTADASHLILPIRPELIQEGGVVHGGFLATLADSAAVQVLLPALERPIALSSIEFKMNFLRPGRADGGDLHARASLVKRGRRIALLDVEVQQDDQLVAKGLFTYLVANG